MCIQLPARKLIAFLDRIQISNHKQNREAIVLNNKRLLGYLNCIAIEKGFYMLIINCKVLSDFTLKVNSNTKSDYCFSYYFPEVLHGKIKSHDVKAIPMAGPSLFISNSHNETEFFFKKGSNFKASVFIISQNWLQTQLANYSITPFFTSLSKAELLLLKTLTKHIEEEKSPFLIKVNAFNLFLYSLENRSYLKKEAIPLHEDYKEILTEVEKTILEHLYTAMPSINELAKEFYISTSTLKRQFKKIFGSNIYEYYLTRKMELAKDILVNQHANVAEVAATLHYENVSHFIRIFKKVHGILPGKLLHKRA